MPTIYGVDVSKNHLDIYGRNQVGQVVRKRIKNTLSVIESFLLSIEKDVLICAEFTGVYSELLAFTCHNLSINIALINGYTLKHSIGDVKGKSDVIDALKIWEYGNRFADKLRYFQPEEHVIQELKELHNLRNQLVKQRKMVLTSQTARAMATANSLFAHSAAQQIVEQFTKQIVSLEKEMITIISNSHLSNNMEIVTSIKGIGPITAIELIITSGNFKKLTSGRKVAAYAGVCPYPNQSGNMTYRSRVHPRSDRKLKSVLYMAAVAVCRVNKEFRMYRDRKLSEGKHYFLVMNNVINKLLRIIYALIDSGQTFDIAYLPVDPRTAK